MKLSFRTKLTIFIGAILVAIQVVNTAIVYTSTRRNALDAGRSELNFTRNTINRQIDALTTQLAEGARAVMLDSRFREAIAVGTAAAKRSVIRDLRDRISADRVFLISQHGNILFDTAGKIGERPFPFPGMIRRAAAYGRAVTNAPVDNTLYRLVVVPVLAPEPIAWIGIGLALNDALARRLRLQASVPMHLSFAFRTGNRWALAASTLDEENRNVLTKSAAALATAKKPEIVDMGGAPYIVVASTLDSADDAVEIFLQYSAEQAIGRTYPLLLSMIVLLIGGLGLALVGGFMMARGVSRPLRQLVDAAERVGNGDYETTIDLKGNDEFGTLSSTFNDMMSGIRTREEKISHQARYDALTGLLNRAEFLKEVSERLDGDPSDSHTTVVVLGVERLPETNSTLGYEVGDALIIEIAERLKATTAPDDLLARLGGDTFGLMFNREADEGAEAIVTRLEAAFVRPIPIRDFVLAADIRFGLAFHHGAGGNAEQLIHQAEVSEFKTHGNSHDWHVFDPESDEVNPEQVLLITEMRHALAERQFELHYQPKINLRTEAFFAVEALIRWNHPERGMVPPGRFIPLAEQTGDVRQITQWVLTQALQDAADLRSRGLDIQVAINLSALDLGNRELPDRVAAALATAGLPTGALILEITESSLMAEPAVARASLTRLSEMGVALAVDDYGTGYSSLAYLKELPVNEIKIDQAFVRDMSRNPEDELIVRSTIDLGHNLGLKVAAEGIEEAQSFLRLQRMGCDVGQGFYISRPLKLNDLIRFLETHRGAWDATVPKRMQQHGG